MKKLESSYQYFKKIAETFFVTKFIENEDVKKKYMDCIDAVLNVSNTINTKKGVMVYSKNYGQGKSFLFEVLYWYFMTFKNRRLFKCTTAKDLVEIYKVGGKEELDKFIKVKDLFIDDIGDELRDGGNVVSHFGEKMNVIRYVILERYKHWTKNDFRTLLTTNLAFNEIAEKYDGRVSDRLKEMVHLIDFTFIDGSFRQMKGAERISAEKRDLLLEKYRKEIEVEKVDLKSHFNEMMKVDETKISYDDFVYWRFLSGFMIDNGIMVKEDVKKSDVFNAKKMIAENKANEKKAGKRVNFIPVKVTTDMIRAVNIEDAEELALAVVAREKFLELRKQNFILK